MSSKKIKEKQQSSTGNKTNIKATQVCSWAQCRGRYYCLCLCSGLHYGITTLLDVGVLAVYRGNYLLLQETI